jgi:hypothetical protein
MQLLQGAESWYGWWVHHPTVLACTDLGLSASKKSSARVDHSTSFKCQDMPCRSRWHGSIGSIWVCSFTLVGFCMILLDHGKAGANQSTNFPENSTGQDPHRIVSHRPFCGGLTSSAVDLAVLIFDRLKEFVYGRRRHHRRIAAGLKTWKELVVFEDCL